MEENKELIFYENVSQENFVLINFFNDNHEEFLVIHEFINSGKNDYIVIGKFTIDQVKLSKMKILQWINFLKDLVMNYKENVDKLELTYQKKYNVLKLDNLTEKFKFTQEGYDVITNKFLFTDYKMERTVKINCHIQGNGLLFENKYKIIKDQIHNNNKDAFNDLNYYDKDYFFTLQERNRLNMEQVLSYVKHNPVKIKKALSSFKDPWYKDMFMRVKNREIDIDSFLVQVVDAKMELIEQNHKTR